MPVDKGYVTQTVNAMRIVDGGEITSLAQNFNPGVPFSLKLIPKAPDNTAEYVMGKVNLIQWDDDLFRDWPIDILSWTSEMFYSLSSESAGLLVSYRIFWGAGSDAKNIG